MTEHRGSSLRKNPAILRKLYFCFVKVSQNCWIYVIPSARPLDSLRADIHPRPRRNEFERNFKLLSRHQVKGNNQTARRLPVFLTHEPVPVGREPILTGLDVGYGELTARVGRCARGLFSIGGKGPQIHNRTRQWFTSPNPGDNPAD